MKSKWKLNEIIFVAISGMAIAVIFFGWTFIYTLIKPLKIFGLNYLFTGMWVAGGIFIPYISDEHCSVQRGKTKAFFQWLINAREDSEYWQDLISESSEKEGSEVC